MCGWEKYCQSLYAGARDHQAVVISCSHLARRWVALERRSAWLVVDAQVNACSRETHNSSRASKTYGHNAFQIIHIYTPLLSTVVAHTLLNTAHTVGSDCGYNAGWCRSRPNVSDLKCVEWDVKPCSMQSNTPVRKSTTVCAETESTYDFFITSRIGVRIEPESIRTANRTALCTVLLARSWGRDAVKPSQSRITPLRRRRRRKFSLHNLIQFLRRFFLSPTNPAELLRPWEQ